MTYTSPQQKYEASTLSLPRILCLHGGGVNASVFRIQCRAIMDLLRNRFRFVFVDAPFPSAPHEAIVDYFGEFAPFFRWLRWKADHPEIDGKAAADVIMDQCRAAMDHDQGTGQWVGLLGFSQGARIAASLLWALGRMDQVHDSESDSSSDEEQRRDGAMALRSVKFGVLMAGSGPLVMLDSRGDAARYIADAGTLSTMVMDDLPQDNRGDHAIKIPTLHVHGLKDAALERQRLLLNKYCSEGTARLVEWDGGHRVTIKTPDVKLVVDQILELAQEAGV